MIGEWKVLVYDRAGRDILLPLFTVAQLKNLGITVSCQKVLQNSLNKNSFSYIYCFIRTVNQSLMLLQSILSNQPKITWNEFIKI